MVVIRGYPDADKKHIVSSFWASVNYIFPIPEEENQTDRGSGNSTNLITYLKNNENQKGFGSINKEDYSAKMRELKISYFMQCVD